ncbi:MAG: T9SS type A sorting domain-containing protein [bacterium]
MKKNLFVLMTLLLGFVIQTCHAQSYSNEPPVLPLKTSGSVLFGQDIVINNRPDQDQRNLTICSAPNGWLYSAYSYDSLGQSIIELMRSKDKGLSWQFLGAVPFLGGPSEVIKKLDILVTGNNEPDQKLFLAVLAHEGLFNADYVEFDRLKCDPFNFETQIFRNTSKSYHDIAIASDNNYPAIGSNPNSIGVVYSKTGTRDSLIFYSSSDGGITFNNRKVIATTTKRFHKVALSYGVSLSQNTGRYFAAWEEQADSISNLGHIYTSHSNPNFNSSFTTPLMLDGIDPSLTNLCRNPVIACQANNVDNDSANLSEVVLFEKFNPGSGDYDVTGFYNKKAATANVFTRLNIAVTTNNELRPSIAFNPYDSTFTLTYFDSTTQKLPLLNKNFNLANPDNWNIVSPGYNGNNNLTAPGPKIIVSEGMHKACSGWTGNQSSGKGVALFDATYIPSVGIAEDGQTDMVRLIRIFPNPCTTTMTVSFEVKCEERIVISLRNLFGQQVANLSDQTWQEGIHSVSYNVSTFSAGIYYYTFKTGTYMASGKICIIR